MPDWRVLGAILALGLACYAMRAAGFMAVGSLPEDGTVSKVLRLAPGNLFIAFAAAGCLQGGWPSLAGCLLALATMMVTKKEWAALGVGFAAAAAVSAWFAS
jgi:branched-subunit amino acid transport protein